MKVNDESIYGTRALAPFKEGKVCISKKGANTIYIYYLADENEKMPPKIELSTFSLPLNVKIRMLGTNTFLRKENKDSGVSIIIPDKIRKNPPSEYVWVMKATF
jgi:alpha-L-fucosidase